MPVFKRPEAELYYEVHGPNIAVQKVWRGPAHLEESIRRVGEFRARNTPA
jgi:hypothetical protein